MTVVFEHPSTGFPFAMTVAVLRPELFRVAIESPAACPHDGLAGGPAPAADDQEPP
jgi:hypothetical protein